MSDSSVDKDGFPFSTRDDSIQPFPNVSHASPFITSSERVSIKTNIDAMNLIHKDIKPEVIFP